MIKLSDEQLLRPINRLILLRKYHHLSQADMSAICGISDRTYQRIEYGEAHLTVPILLKICQHLKIDVNYFFKESSYFDNKDLVIKQYKKSNIDCTYANLFNRICEEIQFFLEQRFKSKPEYLSEININELSISDPSLKELGISQKKFKIKDLAKISDIQVKLAHEFILENSNKIVINHSSYHYGPDGEIESINLFRNNFLKKDSPRVFFVPIKIKHQNDNHIKEIQEIFAGLKYLYRDLIIILNRKI